MCLFLDVNLNTPTWTFLLIAVSVGIFTLRLYGQFMDITQYLQEEKNNSENIQFLELALKQLKTDVCQLKQGIKDSEKEVNSLQDEIKLLERDKTGLVDFAFKGEVVSTRDTETFEIEGTATFGFGFCGKPHLEKRILESFVMPGDCWPIRGQEGTAVIALTRDVLVTKVTLEHTPRSQLPSNTVLATPKHFSLWGIHDENEYERGSDHFFGQFEYSLAKPEVQSFFVIHPSNKTFRFVEFKVESNHGHPDFTCVYRVRVHGVEF